MGLTRRAFLQQVGLGIVAFGLSGASLGLADRCQAVLAQPTRRKLALLIGINQYSEQVCDYVPSRGSALNGSLTDVELQRELLVYRFGFAPTDILTLTDQQATREAIETAFISHLADQAQAGDVVVIHFSGLGSRVRMIDAPDTLQQSLVPIDGILPTDENPAINDLLEDTLGLLLRSLATDQVTTILDTSFTEPIKIPPGNLRPRSRPTTPSGYPNHAELLLQERLFSRLNVTREQIQSEWRSGQLPGILLAASKPDQAAMELQWSGFNAGLFTYALTQHLWQTTPSTTLRIVFSRATSLVNQVVGPEQQPRLSGQKIHEPILPVYQLKPTEAMGADGVVIAVEDEGKTVQLWLGGLPALLLEYYGINSTLAIASPDAEVQVQLNSEANSTPVSADAPLPTIPSAVATLVQVRSRDGLTVKAKLLDSKTNTAPPQVGQWVRETMRTIPRNINLVVALDISLERIERVDATSAFAAISRVSAVVAGEQLADYLFGKAVSTAQTLAASLSPNISANGSVMAGLTSELPAKGSYGLFNLGGAVIPNTIGGDEAVKTAVNRLTPQLKTLLAAKLLRLTTNVNSSRLGVRATLEMITPQERIVAQQETSRAPWALPESKLAPLFVGDGDIPTLPIGSRIRYRLHNYSDRPVYFLLLGLDSAGNMIALYPGTFAPDASGMSDTPPMTNNAIAPDIITVLPQALTQSEWVINGPAGMGEVYLIFSRHPFTQAMAALETAIRSSGVYRLGVLSNPLDVAYAILQDLHQSSSVVSKPDAPADTYVLDVNTWATLSFVYRIA
jgi:hypothetical protein